ncbi:bifunctional DNA-formamidopyrimidine glycosylase/DNA-(apurinic or apyrimidinic site) lyase [Lederbergia wuyishanensis]|uniref:Formamidopyrimidine-DNA glycosylase n=1 Tax=Lederbergia wuyishanensis TaxID=1347903 RepID=A0ABU0D6K9_9BACI|nr:bifunctional DNA-formamidopyrimidine glycosylase/DNA-(apurinic or apyrimidinic site) lyase [Lederbergia wuyishanensis]MCJ8008608.1 bifunctional DNA-formamidopyrimidine glycosylase/DNA-(apurinic or apyrimidinic site) lyase [Lederbergia wuyishanensis]MDQ0343976.1 formamidopyrimidine-DNA glycosylase [Lederbergia wuyishanensis]
MPELPEMETYKSMLQQKIGGNTITDIFINREKSINVPTNEFLQRVINQKIESIGRRAKYLIFQLQNGSCLLLHLMLGGRMFYGKEEEKPDRTVQVQFSFGNQNLYFIGLRLGYLHLLSTEMIEKELQNIGPEPLDPNFSLDAFLTALKGRKSNLKTSLINQECIAGIGNRYSDEILWHAQLLPERKIHELDQDHIARLYDSIKFILKQAIQNGGYMSVPLFSGDKRTGGYNNIMKVHGLEGKSCERCRSPIIKTEISSRKTYFCKNCQH